MSWRAWVGGGALAVVAGQGLSPIPSGVVRVMELQEKGYAYIRP